MDAEKNCYPAVYHYNSKYKAKGPSGLFTLNRCTVACKGWNSILPIADCVYSLRPKIIAISKA